MALTIDKADVLLVAPELSAVTDAQWDDVLADVEMEVSVSAFGSQAAADRAGKQLAAHFGTERFGTSGGGGAAGPVQSISVGAVSKTFATPSAVEGSQFGGTKYGREYLRLVRLFCPRIAVT